VSDDRRHFLVAGVGVLAGACLPGASVIADGEPKPKSSKPKVVADGVGEKVRAMGVKVTVKVKAEDTGGAYSVFEDVIPPGGGPPPHTHSKEDEMIYVVEGELVAFLDGKNYDVKAGAWVHMPRGVEHYFKNVSDKPTRMILTYTPGGFEKWFLEVGTPVKEGDSEPPPATAEDIKKAVTAAAKYSFEFHKK
jgi:quercetin dioxygenase-like cupin family protein